MPSTTPWSRRKSLQTCFNGRVHVGELLSKRRRESAERLEKLRHELREAELLCADTACVYATGSFARGEAHFNSDLDLFIVGKMAQSKPALRKLNETLLKA